MPLVKMPGARDIPIVSSGLRPLDRLLPSGGMPRGSLVEWLCEDDTSGGASLACAVAASLVSVGGTMIVVDRGGRLYPPAVMPWLSSSVGSGSQMIVVRPAHDDDEAWAIDQALRCPGVAAVVAWPRRVQATAMRRWQLAARSSHAVGLFVRPCRARREPSWAAHRIVVTSLPGGTLAVRRLRLMLADGPWALDGGHDPAVERTVEIAFDMAAGREASGMGLQRPELSQMALSRRGAACRAS